MKKILILSFLLTFGYAANAQFTLNSADFTTKVKSLFEQAKKRFATEKSGDAKTIDENGFVKEYQAKTTFTDALYSRLVVDADGVLGHDTRWKIGSNKEEAVKWLNEFHKLLKSAMPANFGTRETWEDFWYDGSVIAAEFQSEQFALQAKQPSAKLGIREKDGTFYIDLIIFEPIFR